MSALLGLTVLHLFVDGVCGAVLASYALREPRMEPIVFYFTLYTVLAFGLQGPVGWMLDKKPKLLKSGLVCASLLLALGALPPLSILPQVVLIGLGNCLFHVAGGSYVLQRYATYTQLGLFVCSGALGLGLGLNSLVGAWSLVAGTIVITLVTIKKLDTLTDSHKIDLPYAKHTHSLQVLICAALLLSCVLLRGFGSGNSILAPSVMVLPCVLALGKFIGGLICDKIGYRSTVLLIFSLGFISLQLQGLYGGLLFILACNMTMPLTLRLAHWCRPTAPGLMFGLAASCLVPGTVFKGLLSFSPQLILVLQFLILCLAGYILLEEAQNAES